MAFVQGYLLKFNSFLPSINSKSVGTIPHNGFKNVFTSKKCKSYIRMSVTEDPVATRVREELAADGINMDELLNAGKVVNLTRKLDKLNEECTQLTIDSKEYTLLRSKIDNIERTLVKEKRQVMQQWLKQLFSFQAIIFIALGGALSTDTVPGYSIPLVGQALGFWMTWLFTIPALRARKGTQKWEKSALNVAFLTTPLVNLSLPVLTKNCGIIWAADIAVLLGCYGYYFVKSDSGQNDDEKGTKEQARVTGILKYLDWGSWKR